MFSEDRKMTKLKNVIIGCVVYFFSSIVTIWHIIDEYLFAKDLFLYTFFQPNTWWIGSLILTIVLFVMMHLFAKPLLFLKRSQQEEKNVKKEVEKDFLRPKDCNHYRTDVMNYIKLKPFSSSRYLLNLRCRT